MGLRLLFLLMLLWNPAAWGATPPAVMVLGDSLSAGHGIDVNQGWVALLARRLETHRPAWRVVNASISGDTTRGGLARLPAALARTHPRIVIVELGGNDGLRGLTLEEMQDNLTRIVTTVRTAGARVLLVGVRLPPNYGPAYTQRFHAVYTTVAARMNIPLVPYLLAGVDDRPQLMQADGIHPTAAAQPRLLDNVWKMLAGMLAR